MEEHGHVTVAVHSCKTVNDKQVIILKLKQIRVTARSMNVSMCYTNQSGTRGPFQLGTSFGGCRRCQVF